MAPPRPTVQELVDDPQLAIVAMLDAAIDNAVDALNAAYPELSDVDDWADGCPEPPGPEVYAALILVRLAEATRNALRGYRRSVSAERSRASRLSGAHSEDL